MNKIKAISPVEVLQRREEAKDPYSDQIPQILTEINGVLNMMGVTSTEDFSFSARGYPRSLVEPIAYRLADAGWDVRLYAEDAADYGFVVSFPGSLQTR